MRLSERAAETSTQQIAFACVNDHRSGIALATTVAFAASVLAKHYSVAVMLVPALFCYTKTVDCVDRWTDPT